jgi:iron complex outermembrane receptor protein
VHFATPYGKYTAAVVGTYVDKYELQPGSDLAFVSYLGNSFNGGNAYPRWMHVATIDGEYGPWGGTLEQTFTAGWVEAFQGGGTHEIPSTSRVNLQGRYSGIRHLTLKLGVRNVMDRLPPYTDVSSYGSHAAGWANSVADPRGRFWYGSVTYAFK